MNVGVIGCGYVGLSNAILLANQSNVMLWDINQSRMQDILNGILPFDDCELESALAIVKDNLSAAKNIETLAERTQLVIIAMPTDYCAENCELKVSDIEETVACINKASKNKDKIVVIRSTIPIGFTDKLQEKYGNIDIYFMPEFLREGKCFHDTLFPERIVIGGGTENINFIHQLYCNSMKVSRGNSEVKSFFITRKEAEAVKLFSNAYLAMRVSFFNELDMFAEMNEMSSKKIIDAVCADCRVGDIYNSPSFGYGGYCLPKDTKQLATQTNFPLISSINESNNCRINYIVQKCLNNGGPIGIYRILAKNKSNSTRFSVTFEVIKELSEHDVKVIYYEPLLNEKLEIRNTVRVEKVSELAEQSKLILANWIDSEILPYRDKVYTRDQVLL